MPSPRRLSALATAALLATTTVLATTSAAHAAGVNYVALGDSYAAGPLIPTQTGSPIGCLRSNHSYPYLVASALHATAFDDASCSGATTADMAGSQSVTLGTNAPELNALSSATTLVTLTIGGNDIGFAGIVLKCAELSFTNPFGSPCENYYGTQLAQRITALAPEIGTVLREIHTRAPNARVLVVGYLEILPHSVGCWPAVPVSIGDVPYLDGVEQKLNGMLASEADSNGATYVDAYAGDTAHTACATASQQWVVGILLDQPAAPDHPTTAGMSTVAARVEAAAGA
jgi:lysophospholipase L1-like esterase